MKARSVYARPTGVLGPLSMCQGLTRRTDETVVKTRPGPRDTVTASQAANRERWSYIRSLTSRIPKAFLEPMFNTEPHTISVRAQFQKMLMETWTPISMQPWTPRWRVNHFSGWRTIYGGGSLNPGTVALVVNWEDIQPGYAWGSIYTIAFSSDYSLGFDNEVLTSVFPVTTKYIRDHIPCSYQSTRYQMFSTLVGTFNGERRQSAVLQFNQTSNPLP